MKIPDREQASRDRKWIGNNAKNDDWSDRSRDQRRGFDACPQVTQSIGCKGDFRQWEHLLRGNINRLSI
jgi:hypothetical protein